MELFISAVNFFLYLSCLESFLFNQLRKGICIARVHQLRCSDIDTRLGVLMEVLQARSAVRL
jgi:hypothetical protein